MKKFINLISILSIISLVVFSGCGKNQTSGTLIGGAAGGTFGALISQSPEGTALGAAIGGLIGSSVGANEDRKEEKAIYRSHVQSLHSENQALRQAQEKWCSNCRTKGVLGANTCSFCGVDLISKKVCRRCGANFKPNDAANFCPYCPGGIRLAGI